MFFLYGIKGYGKAKERFFLGSGLNFEEAKAACHEAIKKLGYDRSYIKTFGAELIYFLESDKASDLPVPDRYEPIPCVRVDPNPRLH